MDSDEASSKNPMSRILSEREMRRKRKMDLVVDSQRCLFGVSFFFWTLEIASIFKSFVSHDPLFRANSFGSSV